MIYHYPLYIRLWHLLNAILFLVLILTGLSMQYSNPDAPRIPFESSVQIHNICGILLTANYMIFLIGNRASGNREHYRLQWKGLQKRMMQQLRYYITGYLRGEEPPFPLTEERKFNPLKAFAYATAMYAGMPVLFITGWGLLFPEIIPVRFFGVSGVLVTALIHVITGFLLSIFMLIHIYACTIGKSPRDYFRPIVTGWAAAEKSN